MPAQSFIDVVFSQFAPHIWRLGTGIYRAGSVIQFSVFKELVSARLKAGIGEIYEVRLKLHSQGKCVQWMECTCQANRRHNEKCPHLAAFCIYLDQEKSELLAKMNLGSGDSDKYLFGDKYSKTEDTSENEPIDSQIIVTSIPKNVLRDDEKRGAEGESAGWLKDISYVVLTDVSEHEPLLLLTVKVKDRKKLTYCLGIDDAIEALKQKEITNAFSVKMTKMQTSGVTAARFFDVRLHSANAIKITRCISLRKEGEDKEKVFTIDKFLPAHVGRKGLFLKTDGFIPFVDNLTQVQVGRWAEYPVNAMLEGDTAAILFEGKFQRLFETAEVRVGQELSNLNLVREIKFEELRLKTGKDGKILLETDEINNGDLISIIKARAEGRKYLSTKSGWIKLTEDLDWLKDKVKGDNNLQMSSLDIIKFREQFAVDSKISGQDPVVERLRVGLISSQEITLPTLTETNLSLRHYQEDGLKWLWWLFQNGLSGLLADEMGLGKTHQAMGLLSLIAREHPGNLSLVVCPTTVIDHWLDKLKRFVPSLDVFVYHGTKRRIHELTAARGHRVIITSYGVMLRDVDTFSELQWSVIILDEAHLVKNQTTRTYRAACRLPSRMRLCLTGTPLENDLMELKNLFDYILPNYLGSDNEFKKKYLKDDEQNKLVDLDLHRIIHPFKMRRNKIDVLQELPDKIEDMRFCHLNKDQHKLYTEALSLRGAALVEALKNPDEHISYVHIFSVITLLKQICDDPALVDPRYEGMGSGKLSLLDELIDEALESDQKVVIFSQYAKMIERLSARFASKKIDHCVLTGSTLKRGEVVRSFQENSNKKIFLGSLLAGGAGIDLTSANVVIHYDRWWNAAKENQATDRVHRIGQTRNVQVYKLVTRGTLEERIDEIINRKRIVFERFVEQDAEVFKHLSRDDLLNLLTVPKDNSPIEEMDYLETHDLS